MKKIILLLCFMMFMVVGAKHYNGNDNDPNASVLIKLNYPKIKGSVTKKSNTSIQKVDSLTLNTGLNMTNYQSIKVEPGFRLVRIVSYPYSFFGGGQSAEVLISYNFLENKTYYIDVHSNGGKFITQIRDSEEGV